MGASPQGSDVILLAHSATYLYPRRLADLIVIPIVLQELQRAAGWATCVRRTNLWPWHAES